MSPDRDRLAAVYNQALADMSAGRREQAEAGLKEARALLSALVKESPGEPELPFYLAAACYNLGNLASERGQAEQAVPWYEEAAAALRPQVEGGSGPVQVRNLYAQSTFNLGNMLLDGPKPGTAARHFRSARDVWVPLVQECPDEMMFRHDLARAHFNLAYAEACAGKPDSARDSYRQAQPIWEELLRQQGDVGSYRFDLGRSYFNLGAALEQCRQGAEAVTAYRQALAHFQILAVRGPDQQGMYRGLLQCVQALTRLLQSRGRPAELPAVQAAVVQVLAERAREKPDPDLLSELGQAQLQQASLCLDAGSIPEADMAYRQAHETWTKLVQARPDDPAPSHFLAATAFDHGILLKGQGRYDEAEECYRRALAIWQTLAQRDPAQVGWVASTYNHLGILYSDTGRLGHSDEMYAEARALRQQRESAAPQDADNLVYLAGTLCNMAHNARERGRYDEALALYDRCLGILDRARPTGMAANLARQFRRNATGGRQRSQDPGKFAVQMPPGYSMATLSWRPAGPLALAEAVEDGDPRRVRARELLAAGDPQGALGELAGDSPGVLCDRADLLRWLGREEEALQAADALVGQHPGYAPGWYVRGLVLGRFLGETPGPAEPFDHERQEECGRALDEAVRLRPGHAASWDYRGRALGALAHAAQARLRALADVRGQERQAELASYLTDLQRRYWLYFGGAWESLERAGELGEGEAWLALGRHLTELQGGFERSARSAQERAEAGEPGA